MESEIDALRRLAADGYENNFALAETGHIAHQDVRWLPAEVVVDHLLRFEGMSDPGDESMVLALTGPDGARGTLTMPYGPLMTADQADAARALVASHRDGLEANSPRSVDDDGEP